MRKTFTTLAAAVAVAAAMLVGVGRSAAPARADYECTQYSVQETGQPVLLACTLRQAFAEARGELGPLYARVTIMHTGP